MNPAWAFNKANEFFNVNKSQSKSEGKKEDIFISGMYPEYYIESQHFKSDGWLSSSKAGSYEFAMETLLTGAGDTI